jgi:hypothetical protein
MARIRSTSPVGVPPRDTSTDTSIFRRWLTAAVGDVALASDLATGANSTTPIDHSGAPNGCQLRFPLAAQHIGRSIVNLDTDGYYYIIAVPIFVRAGEGGQYRMVVEVSPYGDDPVTLEVRDTAWALTINPTPGERTQSPVILASTGSSPFTATVTWTFELPVGISYILVKRLCRPDTVDTGATLFNWALDHQRTGAGSNNGIVLDGTAAQGSPYGALASYAPANVLEFFDEEVATDGPLSGYVTARLNRKINALWEYVTGGTVPGNVARQISNTWNNNRATWTAEALLEFPIACVAVGASGLISGPKTPSLTQLSGWIRYPDKHSTSVSTFCRTFLQFPESRTSPSVLRVEVLMESPDDSTLDGTPGWRFNAVVDGFAASADVQPVRIGAAPNRWWRATITSIPFSSGGTRVIDIRIKHTTNAALTQLVQITGVCIYIDP